MRAQNRKDRTVSMLQMLSDSVTSQLRGVSRSLKAPNDLTYTLIVCLARKTCRHESDQRLRSATHDVGKFASQKKRLVVSDSHHNRSAKKRIREEESVELLVAVGVVTIVAVVAVAFAPTVFATITVGDSR